MTFWYVFTEWTYFFSNFFKLYFLGIDHDPPCSLCSHDLCLFLFLMFHSSHDHMAKRSHYRIMIFCGLRSSILRTHPHPHSLPLPPQLHHPYTHHLGPRNTDPPGEESPLDEMCGDQGGPDCTEEDYVRPRLEPARVRLVLPSKKSGPQDGRCCREPLPDQARFGRQ